MKGCRPGHYADSPEFKPNLVDVERTRRIVAYAERARNDQPLFETSAEAAVGQVARPGSAKAKAR